MNQSRKQDAVFVLFAWFFYVLYQEVDEMLSVRLDLTCCLIYYSTTALGTFMSIGIVCWHGPLVLLSGSCFTMGLLASSLNTIFRYNQDNLNVCPFPPAMVGFSAIYGLICSGFPVAVYFMMAERYDATQQPFRCFLWGSGAPIGITLCNVRLSNYFARFYENYPGCHGGRNEDVTDRVLPLQGILVSMVSLGILSALNVPASPRRIQENDGNVQIPDIWCWTRLCARRTWKSLKESLIDPQLYFFFLFSFGHGFVRDELHWSPYNNAQEHLLPLSWFGVFSFVAWRFKNSRAILLISSIILRATGLLLLFNVRNGLYYVNHTYYGKLPVHAEDFIGLFETHQLTSTCILTLLLANIKGYGRRAVVVTLSSCAYYFGQSWPRTGYRWSYGFILVTASQISCVILYVVWLVRRNTSRKKYSVEPQLPEENQGSSELDVETQVLTDIDDLSFEYRL